MSNSLSALERIRQLQQKHQAELESMKREAVSELVARIAEAKRTLAELSEQYAQLTGKTLTGERIESRPAGAEPKRRVRLSNAELQALPDRIAKIIGGGALGFSEIVAHLPGVPPSAIRRALKNPRRFRMEGSKSTARYLVQ